MRELSAVTEDKETAAKAVNNLTDFEINIVLSRYLRWEKETKRKVIQKR